MHFFLVSENMLSLKLFKRVRLRLFRKSSKTKTQYVLLLKICILFILFLMLNVKKTKIIYERLKDK